MGAGMILVLVGCSFQAQEADDKARLRGSVEALSSENQWDRALELLRGFGGSHPSLKEDVWFRMLLRQTQDLAQEADGLFKKELAEAQESLRNGRFAQAIVEAAGALKIYPEHQSLVKELQDRARERLAGKDLVRIPSKPSWVGSNDHADEPPLRQVTLHEFLVDKYPVTNEDYRAFVAATGAAAPTYWSNGKVPKGKEDHPVVFVTYDDAAAFAKWLGKRLPTAVEWEVAARGTDRREFPWGNVFLEHEDRFPCNCLEYWQVHKTLAPGTMSVQFFAAQGFVSASGASMGGNVWEWTSTTLPKESWQEVVYRILKGGSFMISSRSLRCATVLPENPTLVHPDTGFRCVKDVPQ